MALLCLSVNIVVQSSIAGTSILTSVTLCGRKYSYMSLYLVTFRF